MGPSMKVFMKSLDDLKIPLSQLAQGICSIDSRFSAKGWHVFCERAMLEPKGFGQAHLKIALSDGALDIQGKLMFSIKQECSRTLQPFMNTYDITIEEYIELEQEEEFTCVERGAFDAGEFVTQMILLHIDLFPIHPKITDKSGGYLVLSDGYKEEVAEKSPFAVLKSLQNVPESGKPPQHAHRQRPRSVARVQQESKLKKVS